MQYVEVSYHIHVYAANWTWLYFCRDKLRVDSHMDLIIFKRPDSKPTSGTSQSMTKTSFFPEASQGFLRLRKINRTDDRYL